MNTLAMLRQRPHTSVSQLKCFLQCPRKYFYQYVERCEPDFRPVALAFGTAWHAAIGHHLLYETTPEEVQSVFRDTLAREVEGGRAPVLFEDEEDLGMCIDLGVRMLDTFIERVDQPDQVIGVEVVFSLELADPSTGEILPVPLIGAIDALVVEKNKPCIWELKTSKKKWAADQLEFDLQPVAYKLGARVHEVFDPQLKLIVATKNKKPDVQVETVVRHRADEEELAHVAMSVLRAVDAGVDHPLRGWQCRSCQHASGCR